MPRPHRLMYGLLYPAILGTVLVSIFSPLSQLAEGGAFSGPEFDFGKLLLTLGIVVHFIVDYILGQETEEHGWFGFAVDCLVLAGLWVAAASVHASLSVAPNVRLICIVLAGVYIVFLFYLASIYRRLPHAPLVAAVEAVGLLWFVVGASWLPYVSYAVIGLLVSAGLLLWAGSKALRAARAAENEQ